MKTIQQTRALNRISSTLHGNFSSMDVLKAFGVDITFSREEIELEARVVVAEELRKQETVDNDLLTFESQSKITQVARKAERDALIALVSALEKYSVSSKAIEGLEVILEQKTAYRQKQEEIMNQLTFKYALAYFPDGTKL